VLWFVLSGIYWVRSGYTAVLLKWGNPQSEVKTKGLHWRIPFVERVYVIDQRNQLLKMASLNVTAADKNQITLSGFVLWRVTDPVLYYQQFLMSMPEGDRWFESEISALLSSDVAPQMAWDYLLTHASTLREKCLLSLREKVKGKGIDVVDVGLLDMRVSDDVQAIIIENMQKNRNKLLLQRHVIFGIKL
jgi:membrane protease subunit HflC